MEDNICEYAHISIENRTGLFDPRQIKGGLFLEFLEVVVMALEKVDKPVLLLLRTNCVRILFQKLGLELDSTPPQGRSSCTFYNKSYDLKEGQHLNIHRVD